MNNEKNKKMILVVEDNLLNMKLAVDLLELNGFEVLKAVDGETALQLLKEKVPRLILLDIQLPDLNGFEVLKRIREDSRLTSVKVIALTALAMKEEEKKIREAGFDFFISKPINTKIFIVKVKEILGIMPEKDS